MGMLTILGCIVHFVCTYMYMLAGLGTFLRLAARLDIHTQWPEDTTYFVPRAHAAALRTARARGMWSRKCEVAKLTSNPLSNSAETLESFSLSPLHSRLFQNRKRIDEYSRISFVLDNNVSPGSDLLDC